MSAKVIQFPGKFGKHGTRGQQHDPVAARNKLVEQYMSVVEPIARGIHGMRPPSFDLEDLISVGMLALVCAAESFDRTLNVPFESWAKLKVRGAILDATRRKQYRDSTHEEIQDWHAEMRDPRLSPEEQMIADERVDAVREEIEELPARLKLVVIARYQHRKTLGEIGRSGGMSGSHSVTVLHRAALRDIRTGLEEKGYSAAMRRARITTVPAA